MCRMNIELLKCKELGIRIIIIERLKRNINHRISKQNHRKYVIKQVTISCISNLNGFICYVMFIVYVFIPLLHSARNN